MSEPWIRQGPYFWEGQGQCRVSACRTGQGWRFSAWGPPQMPRASWWDWAKTRDFSELYEVGEPMPWRRTWLGVFETAEGARSACLAFLRDLGGVEVLTEGAAGATGRSGADSTGEGGR